MLAVRAPDVRRDGAAGQADAEGFAALDVENIKAHMFDDAV